MTEEEAIGLLRQAIELAGSQSRFAEKNDIPQSYVSDVLNGNRRPSDRILACIGLRRALVQIEAQQ